MDRGSILEKANKWVGRTNSLESSPEEFQIHLLPGEPEDSQLQSTFVKAQNILNDARKQEFIHENEAEAFAVEFEREVRQYEMAG
jgi:hypothetical protein